jgi:aryl-alcohol dehydrogenase-like predicted oxidoreductase
MTNRRDFLRYATALAATLPLPTLVGAADEPRLPTRPIPGTDDRLPIVGLGNSQAFKDGDLERTRTLFELFHARGGAYVDVIGDARFVAAKVARDMGIQDDLFFGTYVLQTSDEADRIDARKILAAQGKPALDLVLSLDVAEYTRRADSFRRLKEEGLARYVGVARHRAEFHEPMMALMKAGAVDFVQVNYSMLEPEAGERLLPLAQDLGVAILINRPFVNGDYFRLVKGKPLPEWAAEFDCHSWAQFSLKFILSHPAVNCVLTETANPKHAVDNVGGGFGRLPDEATRQRMLATIRGFA